jgi:hypothetical protein
MRVAAAGCLLAAYACASSCGTRQASSVAERNPQSVAAAGAGLTHCGTSLDCPDGERCCAYDEHSESNHCERQCQSQEACVPADSGSGGCRKGFSCAASIQGEEGICLVESPSMACADIVCSGETPLCCYDIEHRSARCVARGDGADYPGVAACPFGDKISLMQCSSPADCGDERCCEGGPSWETQCEGDCTDGGTVCQSVADCPFSGAICASEPGGPPFLKLCLYY